MDLHTHIPRPQGAKRVPHLPGWAAHGVIVAGGAIVLTLMMWGHLGLGAWIAPAPPTAPRQVAMAGPYRVTLVLDTGQFTRGTNGAATLIVQEAAGQSVDGATVWVQPRMLTMGMQAPVVSGIAQGDGHYLVRPDLEMPGEWRLDVTLLQPGISDQHTSFDVNVRWG